MKIEVGELVRPLNFCGGRPGDVRCESALVVNVELSHHESVQVDSQAYHDVEIYEYELICSCGTFEEYSDRVEPV